MADHQAPPSLGFSRQEHWSGLPLPSPMHESEKWSRSVAQSCPTLSNPTDCSLPGSSVHGIFQARVLEWGAIAFSIYLLGHVFIYMYAHSFICPPFFNHILQLHPTLCDTMACQASLSITNSWSLLKLMSIKSVMPSNHIIPCPSLLLLPSVFPSIRIFSSESNLHIRWPK